MKIVMCATLYGYELNYAVAVALVRTKCSIECNISFLLADFHSAKAGNRFALTDYAKNWAKSSFLFEDNNISINYCIEEDLWKANMPEDKWFATGSTPLIAACRSFCKYSFGDYVEIPD